MKPKAWVGIDPGGTKSAPGAAALIYHSNEMPTIGIDYFDWILEQESANNMRHWNEVYDIKLVAIERQWGRPGNSIQNVNKIMKNYGIWIGIVLALGLKYFDPTPRDWQKIVSRIKGEDIKKAYLEFARQIFPDAELHLVKHHGRAAALLIADYCKRIGNINLKRIQ